MRRVKPAGGVGDEAPVNDESFITQPKELVSADKVWSHVLTSVCVCVCSSVIVYCTVRAQHSDSADCMATVLHSFRGGQATIAAAACPTWVSNVHRIRNYDTTSTVVVLYSDTPPHIIPDTGTTVRNGGFTGFFLRVLYSRECVFVESPHAEKTDVLLASLVTA